MYQYQTKGVCSSRITFDIIDGKITGVSFLGGCAGNIAGIAKLIEGMDVNEAIERLKGITCGPRSTSCPDQLAIALEEALKNNK